MNPYAVNHLAQSPWAPTDQRSLLQQGHTNHFVSEGLQNAVHTANLPLHPGSQPTGANGVNMFLPNGQLSQLQLASLLQQQMTGLQLNGGANMGPPGRLLQPQVGTLQDAYNIHNAQQSLQHPGMAPVMQPRFSPGLPAMDAALLGHMMASNPMMPPSLSPQQLNAMATLHAQGLLPHGGAGLGLQGFTPETLAYTSNLYGGPTTRGPQVGALPTSDAQLAMVLANLSPLRLAELQQVILQQQQHSAQAQAVRQQMEAHSQMVNAAAASNSTLQGMRSLQLPGTAPPPPSSMLSGLNLNGSGDAGSGQDPLAQDGARAESQSPHLVTSMATALLNGQLSPRAVLNNRQSPTTNGQQGAPQPPRAPNGAPAEMELIQSVFQGMSLQDSAEAARQLGHANGSADAALDALSNLTLGAQPHHQLTIQPHHRPLMPSTMRPHPAPQLTVGRLPSTGFDSQTPHRSRMSLDLGALPSAQHMGRSSLDVPMYPYGGARRSSLDIATLPGPNSVGSSRVSMDLGRMPPLGGRMSLDMAGMPGSHSSSGRVSLDLGNLPGQQLPAGMGFPMDHHPDSSALGHLGMDPAAMLGGRPQLQVDAALARRRSMEVHQQQHNGAAARALAAQQEAVLARTASAPATDFANLSLGGAGGNRMGGPPSFQLPGMPPPAGMTPSTKEEYKRTMLVQIGEQMARSNISVEQAISAGLLGGMCAADVRVLCTAHGAEVSRMHPAPQPAEQQQPVAAEAAADGDQALNNQQQQLAEDSEESEECGKQGEEDAEQLLQSDGAPSPRTAAAVDAHAEMKGGQGFVAPAEWGGDLVDGLGELGHRGWLAASTGGGAFDGGNGVDRDQTTS